MFDEECVFMAAGRNTNRQPQLVNRYCDSDFLPELTKSDCGPRSIIPAHKLQDESNVIRGGGFVLAVCT